MLTIMKMTFLEMRKKKVLYITIVMSIAFLAMYAFAAKFVYNSFDNTEAMFRFTISSQFMSMGIYVVSLITAFLAIFSSVAAISTDVENGNYDAILSKPIARREVILGRFFGLLMVLIPYVTALYLSIIFINVIFAKGALINFSIKFVLQSMFVLYLLPVVLVSVGIFLSSCMSTVSSGVILVILYFFAVIGGLLEKMSGIMAEASAQNVMSNIGIVTSLIMPSDIIYRKATSILFTTKSGLNLQIEALIGSMSQPSSTMMVYVIIYILFMIFMAVKKFNKRDL